MQPDRGVGMVGDCSNVEESVSGCYVSRIPLIRRSKLTSTARGGVGKNLSHGWCLNYAVGCTHGCPFCYVDSIYKRFGKFRFGSMVETRWGNYLLVPENLDAAIEGTNWGRWRGSEVMLSSTHDPYIPELAQMTLRILEAALPAGVRFCIQTRSDRVIKHLDFISKYKSQVRIQVSIATMDEGLAKTIEPRVPSPARRLGVLNAAKEYGIETGVIVAPILPPTKSRPDVRKDLSRVSEELASRRIDRVYGESLHARGVNLRAVEEALGESLIFPSDFDLRIGADFLKELQMKGIRGTWWPSVHSRGPSLFEHAPRGGSTRGEPSMSSSGGDILWRGDMRAIETGLRNTSKH